MEPNHIRGKILQKETGRGIRDLLVVVFDIDPATKPEEVIDNIPMPPGDRIGSVLTGADGSFEIDYDDTDFRVRNESEQRPDLQLAILAPSDNGSQGDAILATTPVRQNAGRSEQFLVRLTGDQLTKAGIPLPTTPGGGIEDSRAVVQRLMAAGAREGALIDGVRQVSRQRVARIRAETDAFHISLKPKLIRSLSRVPDSLLGSPTLVAPTESVTDKNSALISQGIQQVINSSDPAVRPPTTGYVALTEAQKQAVSTMLDPSGAISAEDLNGILAPAPGAAGPTAFLVRVTPHDQLCRTPTQVEQDGAAALGLGPAPSGTGSTGGPGADANPPEALPVTNQDILRYVGRLMTTMSSPEDALGTGLEPRADRLTVQEEIQQLSFGPSPADVPAYYSFHNLQIAFEHTWQELIDQGLINLSEGAYQQIVGLGGDPAMGGTTIIVDPVHDLVHEGRTVLTAHQVVRDHRGNNSALDGLRDILTSTLPDGAAGGTSPGAYGSQDVDPLDRLPAVLDELENRLKEEYAFTIYAADRQQRSINFGILITYLEEWLPRGYQAGRLVKTLTLAPRETRKYSKKTVSRRKRSVREVENHLRSRREESTETTRAEQDIVRKATASTNFSLTSEQSVKVPEMDMGGTTTTSFQKAAGTASEDTKRAFHEAVFKAAQEFKDENTTEVNTEESLDVEVVEAGEITNPNDELAVTCLFYELQRRYRVTEQIHRITPVILVALEFPRPDEIDEAWLLANDWILRRVILDDSFLPALDYLAQNIAGDEIALREIRQNVLQQRAVVEQLRGELGVVRERLAALRQLSEQALLHSASGGGGGGAGPLSFIPVVGDLADNVVNAVEGAAGEVASLLFSNDSSGATAQDTLKDAMDRTADDARDLMFRLEREVTALNDITEKYARALADHFNHKAEIDRLRMHIKKNAMYYVQAIYSHMPSDEIYFMLHKTPVPVIQATHRRVNLGNLTPARPPLALAAHRLIPNPVAPPTNLYPARFDTQLDPNLTFTTLAEVADLDNFLGFKGNYMVFPLRQSNPVTDIMMQPYVVAGLNELVDPDDLANWTLEDFSGYVLCLKDKLTQDEFDAIKPTLQQQYQQILTNPQPNGDEITVPTNSLFITLLPDTHTMIEKFKALHRLEDAYMAIAGVRQAELENVRLASRILAGERQDPHIDKMIVVEGGPVPVSDT
jgi:hypothetical protein